MIHSRLNGIVLDHKKGEAGMTNKCMHTVFKHNQHRHRDSAGRWYAFWAHYSCNVSPLFMNANWVKKSFNLTLQNQYKQAICAPPYWRTSASFCHYHPPLPPSIVTSVQSVSMPDIDVNTNNVLPRPIKFRPTLMPFDFSKLNSQRPNGKGGIEFLVTRWDQSESELSRKHTQPSPHTHTLKMC